MKSWALAFLGAALLFGAGFGLGWCGGNARTPDVHETEHVAVQDHATTATAAVAAEAKTQIVYRERTTKPDGTVVERTSERTDTHAVTHTDTLATSDHSSTTDRTRTVTTPLPDWRVGLLAGAGVQFLPTPSVALEVGLHVERRLIGPLSAGLWVLVQPPLAPTVPLRVAGGVSLSLEF